MNEQAKFNEIIYKLQIDIKIYKTFRFTNLPIDTYYYPWISFGSFIDLSGA